MSVRRLLLVFLALPLLVACAGGPQRSGLASTPAIIVTADARGGYQRIEHFGVSAAWWAQDVGTWPEPTRKAMLDLLFDPHKGIGLEVVRYNLGGGKAEGRAAGILDPWHSVECPLMPEGGLDWSRDAAAMSVIDGAVERGAKVIVFCNSPPASMTVTGAPAGNGNRCNLRPDAQESFAAYLARCAWDLNLRWPLLAISPINEPQWPWAPTNGQEGCHYSPQEAASVLTATATALARQGLSLLLSMPESGGWGVGGNHEYIEAITASFAEKPELAASIGDYAIHPYWGAPKDRDALSALLSSQPSMGEIWITEWTELRSGKDKGMRAALVLADTVHDDFVHGNASSWQYWIAASKYDYADGLLYVDPRARTFETTKKLWALGNWSRFVKPGAFRLACSASEIGPLRISAFKNGDGSIVFVVVNNAKSGSFPLRLELSSGELPRRSARSWETSSKRDLGEIAFNRRRPFSFASESVTTVVFR